MMQDNKDKVIEYADKIDISSQHLLGIINDVLDMSKIEAGKTVFKYTDFSILDFITGTQYHIPFTDRPKKSRLLRSQKKISGMSG